MILQVYMLKATRVPQTKLHEKLIQATQVIIALVKEKEELSDHISTLLQGKRTLDTSCRMKHTIHQSTQTTIDSFCPAKAADLGHTSSDQASNVQDLTGEQINTITTGFNICMYR